MVQPDSATASATSPTETIQFPEACRSSTISASPDCVGDQLHCFGDKSMTTRSKLGRFLFGRVGRSATSCAAVAHAGARTGNRLGIKSTVLGEERLGRVHWSVGYEPNTLKHPVIYMIDGNAPAALTAGTIEFLVQNGQI